MLGRQHVTSVMHETDATVGEGQFTTVVDRPEETGRHDTGGGTIEGPVVDTGTAAGAALVGPRAEGVARSGRPGHGHRRSGVRGVHPRGDVGSGIDRPDAVSDVGHPDCGGGLCQAESVDSLSTAVRAPLTACDPARPVLIAARATECELRVPDALAEVGG